MSDPPNPWSTDQPVAPAPPEFVFSEPEEPTTTPTPHSEVSPQGERTPVTIDTTARRRWLAAGALTGAVTVALLVSTALRSTADSDESSDQTPAATSPAEALPDVSVATTTPSRPSTTTRSTAAESTLPAAPPTWTKGILAVPPRLAQFSTPTQLVALSNRGRVIEIDLATGMTATLDLDRRQFNGQLHLRSRVALITGDGGSGVLPPLIVERGRPPVNIELPGSSGGFFVHNDGSNIDTFRATVFNNTSGEQSSYVISLNGAVSEIDDRSEGLFYGRYAVFTGERLIFDSGDLFLVSPPGQKPETARRISTGTLISRSARSILVLECSETRVCDEVVIDIESGERTAVPDNEDVRFDQFLRVAEMAPNGSALLMLTQNGDAQFFDLATGELTDLPLRISTDSGTPIFSWMPDGSGVITLQGGEIVFVDRITGAVTSLPIEFADIDAIVDVRARPTPSLDNS